MGDERPNGRAILGLLVAGAAASGCTSTSQWMHPPQHPAAVRYEVEGELVDEGCTTRVLVFGGRQPPLPDDLEGARVELRYRDVWVPLLFHRTCREVLSHAQVLHPPGPDRGPGGWASVSGWPDPRHSVGWGDPPPVTAEVYCGESNPTACPSLTLATRPEAVQPTWWGLDVRDPQLRYRFGGLFEVRFLVEEPAAAEALLEEHLGPRNDAGVWSDGTRSVAVEGSTVTVWHVDREWTPAAGP